MKYKLLKAVVVGLTLNVSTAFAGIINFNAEGTQTFDFTLDQLITDNFIITKESDGLGHLTNDLPTTSAFYVAGKTRLLTWTNTSSESGFSLTTDNGDLFSLESFQTDHGYADDITDLVDSVTVSGLKADGTTISYSTAGVGKTTLANDTVNDWIDLVSVEFTAFGVNNTANWDSIRYDRYAAAVSEPATLTLLMLGLLGLSTRKFMPKR